jgi:hypothetical protein
MHTGELQKARKRLKASGRQASFLVARISSAHTISLCTQTTYDAHVNHPVLLKTSDQPSFCSAIFSPFTSAEAIQASDISSLPSLDLRQILVVEKEIKGSPYKNLRQIRKKSNRPLNPKLKDFR